MPRWRVGLFTGFTSLELVFAPLRDFDDGSYAARLHGVLWDIGLFADGAAYLREAPTVRLRSRRQFGRRRSAPRSRPGPTRCARCDRSASPSRATSTPFGRSWASIDHVFDIGTGLYVLLEHLYNGNALGFGSGKAGPLLGFFAETDVPPDPLIPPPTGTVRHSGERRHLRGQPRGSASPRNQTGFQLGYDLTPEMRGNFLAIYDWQGQSAAFFPSDHLQPAGLAWS